LEQGQAAGSPLEEVGAMNDMLLEWMSFKMTGHITDLPSELAGTRPRRTLENLVTLAHAELDGAHAWRIAPPVLAGGPFHRQPPFAVLCGARTPVVMDRLYHSAAECGALVESTEIPDLPSTVRVSAPSVAAIAATARVAGISFQPEGALAVLACTPAIRYWPRQACEMVGGKVGEVRKFSRSRLTWVASTIDAAKSARTGFFRIQRDYDWVSILKTDVSECAYIDDRAGRIAAAAKLSALRWDASSEILSIPSQLYPPALIARGLTLCTGGLPVFDRSSRQISFAGVAPAIFRMVQAITGLKAA
jgi:hypothetical protein